MKSIFSYAKASSLVVELLCRDFGCKREHLSCDSLLESDCKISGVDAYELLERIENDLNVDMSEFDCHERITPDHMSAAEMLWMVGFVSIPPTVICVLKVLAPEVPLLIGLLVGVCLLCLIVWLLKKTHPHKHVKPEIRLGDLIRSVEARRWVSPNNET